MLKYDIERCIGCGKCVDDCLRGNIALAGGKVDFANNCILCGHCVAVCPTKAFAIPEFDMSDVEPFDSTLYGIDPDRLLYTIKARRSIRQYENRSIEDEKLENIVQAGRYTATGSNKQGCRFVVVQRNMATFKKMIWESIVTACEQPDLYSKETLSYFEEFIGRNKEGIDYLFRDAPAVIFVAAKDIIDASLAAQNMELASISHGLGTMYNGYLSFITNQSYTAREWLGVQDKPVRLSMLVGYPRVRYERTAPRKMADVRWK